MTTTSNPPHQISGIRSHLDSIWRLAWPQTLMMVFHFLIGFVDVFVAGQIGDEVQASLGMITQTLLFFLIIAIALANGSVAAISQSLGAGKTLRAVRYVTLVLTLVLAASLLLAALAFPFRGLLLDLLRTPASIRELTDAFLRIYLLLLPVYYLLVVSNAVFRAQKQVHIPSGSVCHHRQPAQGGSSGPGRPGRRHPGRVHTLFARFCL